MNDATILVPRLFRLNDEVIVRFPGQCNIFVLKDTGESGIRNNSSGAFETKVRRILTSGPFGDQTNMKLASVMYDYPHWEAYTFLDRDQFKIEVDRRNEELRTVLASLERHASVLRGSPALEMAKYYPSYRRMRFAKAKSYRAVNLNRVIGHLDPSNFYNWLPNDPQLFKRTLAEVIGGRTHWKRPTEFVKIGGVYWVKTGAERIAAMKTLGLKETEGIVFAYEPAHKIKGIFPVRGYKRQCS